MIFKENILKVFEYDFNGFFGSEKFYVRLYNN